MVWYGMYGMVWYGMVWHGMYGIVSYRIVSYRATYGEGSQRCSSYKTGCQGLFWYLYAPYYIALNVGGGQSKGQTANVFFFHESRH